MIGDFLKPPTDNLYKFMCLSGLILLLVSVIYPGWLLHRATIASFDAEKNAALLDIELQDEKRKAFNDELDRDKRLRPVIEEKVAQMEKQVANKDLSPKKQAQLRSELVTTRQTIDETEKREHELYDAANVASDNVRKKAIELHYQASIALWEMWYGRILIIICGIGSFAGVILGRKGFNLWSTRVQVYQDAILKKQAEQETALNSKSGETKQPSVS